MTVPYPDQSPAPMAVPRFSVHQRITVMVNRYEVRGEGPDGREQLLAMAQQKRLKLKEEVVFTADEGGRPVFSFRARQRQPVSARRPDPQQLQARDRGRRDRTPEANHGDSDPTGLLRHDDLRAPPGGPPPPSPRLAQRWCACSVRST